MVATSEKMDGPMTLVSVEAHRSLLGTGGPTRLPFPNATLWSCCRRPPLWLSRHPGISSTHHYPPRRTDAAAGHHPVVVVAGPKTFASPVCVHSVLPTATIACSYAQFTPSSSPPHPRHPCARLRLTLNALHPRGCRGGRRVWVRSMRPSHPSVTLLNDHLRGGGCAAADCGVV